MRPTEFKLEYNPNLESNIGRPHYFNPDDYCDVVEQMIAADEAILALQMLDHPPAYYRMYPTDRMVELKRLLYNRMSTPLNYAEIINETYEESLAHNSRLNPGFDWDTKGLGAMIDIPFCYPRGPMTHELIKGLNEKEMTPFLWEMGPSNFWLPHGLLSKGLKFNYFAATLHPIAFEDHKQRLKDVWKHAPEPDQKQIFCCFEVAEHLFDTHDILHQYHQYGADADYILLSTPRCTLFGGQASLDREIEHVRSFTPEEFAELGKSLFKGYDWMISQGPMMVLQGVRCGT